MSDLNNVILIGRLTRDPELRYTQSGTAVTNFSIANNRSYVANGEKKENVSFLNCVAWGKLGELIVQYCKKGKLVGIAGKLQQRSWDDQEGKKHSVVEIVIESCQFMPDGNRVDQQQKENQSSDPLADRQVPAADFDNPFGNEENLF